MATVSGKGLVKAVRGGTATITVTDKKDNEYYVKVTVDEDREAYKMTVIGAVAENGVITSASGKYQYYAIRPMITVPLSATGEAPEIPGTASDEEALLDSILEETGAGEGKITVSMLCHYGNADVFLFFVFYSPFGTRDLQIILYGSVCF